MRGQKRDTYVYLLFGHHRTKNAQVQVKYEYVLFTAHPLDMAVAFIQDEYISYFWSFVGMKLDTGKQDRATFDYWCVIREDKKKRKYSTAVLT